jgi:hypothetical protein
MLGTGRRTTWGEAVAWAIIEFVRKKAQKEGQHTSKFLPRELPPEADYGYLLSIFQPLFPEWRIAYTLSGEPVRAGLHIYKVGFDPRYGGGGIWRRLAIPHDASLHDLANVILAAFDFDRDHLYKFCYRDQSSKSREYHHPGMEVGPFADGITLGESGLLGMQTMQFHYDFGDNWCFVAKLERIDPPNPEVKRFQVVESKGTAPEQYPDWEDE